MPEKEVKEVRESPLEELYIVEYTDGTKDYVTFGKRFTDAESAVRHWQAQQIIQKCKPPSREEFWKCVKEHVSYPRL